MIVTRCWLPTSRGVRAGRLGFALGALLAAAGCDSRTQPPSTSPPVVDVRAPASAAATGPPAPTASTAAAVRRANHDGCPFAAPTERKRYDGPVQAAPVLDDDAIHPIPPSRSVERAIAEALDPRSPSTDDQPQAALEAELRQLTNRLKAAGRAARDRPALQRQLAEAHVALAEVASQSGDGTAERSHRRDAIRHYEQILQRYPDRPDVDEVLYRLALEHHRLSDAAGTRKRLLELAQRFCESKLAPQAYFLLGEDFYAAGRRDEVKYELAQEFYLTVLRYPAAENPLWGLARYRIGHAAWRRDDPTKALEAFVEALRYCARFPRRPGTAPLRDDALKAAVRTFAAVGRPDRACGFFHRLAASPPSPERTLAALDDLGEVYLRTGQRSAAITLFRLLERHHRGAARARDRAVLASLGAARPE